MNKNKLTELELPCENTENSRLDLWACGDSVEIYLTHMKYESLQCYLSKENALKLADAIYQHFNK